MMRLNNDYDDDYAAVVVCCWCIFADCRGFFFFNKKTQGYMA